MPGPTTKAGSGGVGGLIKGVLSIFGGGDTVPHKPGATSGAFSDELKHQRFDSARENVMGNTALDLGGSAPRKKGTL